MNMAVHNPLVSFLGALASDCRVAIGFVLLVLVSSSPLPAQRVKPADLHTLLGKWKGSLTYLDYKSGKPYTMPADLEVVAVDRKTQWEFSNIYPDEPEANDKDTLRLTDRGRMFDGESIKSKQRLPNGDLVLVTEVTGTDGNDDQAALIRHTYTIGKLVYEVKKEVRFVGTEQWVLRHTYRYSRIEN